MSPTQTLQKIHYSSFESYRTGDITFRECWDQQREVLEKCEQILRQEIKQLQGLLPSKNKLDPQLLQSGSGAEEDCELEIDDDFQEENTKNDETGKNQTWNIGILSNFIRQNPKANSGGMGKMSEEPKKESFQNVLTNLKANNGKSKSTPEIQKSSRTLAVGKKEKKGQTGKVSYQCPQCSFQTQIFWNLKVHLGTHIGSMFQCTLCDEEHKRKFNVMEHIRAEHKEKRELTNRRWLDNYIVCHCESCDITGTVKEYDQHLHHQHHLPRPASKQWHLIIIIFIHLQQTINIGPLNEIISF